VVFYPGGSWIRIAWIEFLLLTTWPPWLHICCFIWTNSMDLTGLKRHLQSYFLTPYNYTLAQLLFVYQQIWKAKLNHCVLPQLTPNCHFWHNNVWQMSCKKAKKSQIVREREVQEWPCFTLSALKGSNCVKKNSSLIYLNHKERQLNFLHHPPSPLNVRTSLFDFLLWNYWSQHQR